MFCSPIVHRQPPPIIYIYYIIYISWPIVNLRVGEECIRLPYLVKNILKGIRLRRLDEHLGNPRRGPHSMISAICFLKGLDNHEDDFPQRNGEYSRQQRSPLKDFLLWSLPRLTHRTSDKTQYVLCIRYALYRILVSVDRWSLFYPMMELV